MQYALYTILMGIIGSFYFFLNFGNDGYHCALREHFCMKVPSLSCTVYKVYKQSIEKTPDAFLRC